MRQTLSFLAGALCGFVVGAAAALLITPWSGKELQGQARQRYQMLMEEGKQAAAARRAELESQLTALKHSRPQG